MMLIPGDVLHERLLLSDHTGSSASNDDNAALQSGVRQVKAGEEAALGVARCTACATGIAVSMHWHRHADRSPHNANLHTGPCLYLAPDCRALAVREPGSQRVVLLSAQDRFQEPIGTFQPPPAPGDGSGGDLIRHCSWSGDSTQLLVTCQSSCVYLIDRSALSL